MLGIIHSLKRQTPDFVFGSESILMFLARLSKMSVIALRKLSPFKSCFTSYSPPHFGQAKVRSSSRLVSCPQLIHSNQEIAFFICYGFKFITINLLMFDLFYSLNYHFLSGFVKE